MTANALTVGGMARITRAVAPLHGEPRVSAPQTSQLLAGHTVALLESIGDWWRVAGDDKYEGFLHNGYLSVSSGLEPHWSVSLGCTIEKPDRTPLALPLNARIAPDARILNGDVVVSDDVKASFPLSGAAIARSATDYFSGASYQWGGVTPWGCDCSGLVQALFALHGAQLPRDAWQQASVGQSIPMSSLSDGLTRLRESDLLFFSDRDDRRVTHVGMVLSGARMVHSALGRGGVAIESLSDDSDYIKKLHANFTGAQRLLE